MQSQALITINMLLIFAFLATFDLLDAMDKELLGKQAGCTVHWFNDDAHWHKQIPEGISPKAFLETILKDKGELITKARKLQLWYAPNANQQKIMLTARDLSQALPFNNNFGVSGLTKSQKKLNIYSVCKNGTIEDFNKIIWQNEFLEGSEKIDLNKKDIYGRSPLMIAVGALQYDLIKRLIWYGADWNAIIEQESLFQDALLQHNTDLRTGLIFLFQHINKHQKKSELPLAPDLVQKLAYLQEYSKQFKDPYSKYGFLAQCRSHGGLFKDPLKSKASLHYGFAVNHAMDQGDLSSLSYIVHAIRNKSKLGHAFLNCVFDTIKDYTQRMGQATLPGYYNHYAADSKAKISNYISVAQYLIEYCLEDIEVTPQDFKTITQPNHAYPFIFGWGKKITDFYLEHGHSKPHFWQAAQEYIAAMNRRSAITSSPFTYTPSARDKTFDFKSSGNKNTRWTISVPVTENGEIDQKATHEIVCKHFNIPPLLWQKYTLAHTKDKAWKLTSNGTFPYPYEFCQTS